MAIRPLTAVSVVLTVGMSSLFSTSAMAAPTESALVSQSSGNGGEAVPFKEAPSLGDVEDILSMSDAALSKKLDALPPRQAAAVKEQIASAPSQVDGEGGLSFYSTPSSRKKAQADAWMFSMSLPAFIKFRAGNYNNPKYRAYNWTTDLCSADFKVNESWNRKFQNACVRHDFGYRNYGSRSQLKLGAQDYNLERLKIDNNFRKDMDSLVSDAAGHAAAYAYWVGVRTGGGKFF